MTEELSGGESRSRRDCALDDSAARCVDTAAGARSGPRGWEVHPQRRRAAAVSLADRAVGDPLRLAQGAAAVVERGDGGGNRDIRLVADPGKNFALIMKDGVVYKNALE